MRFSRWLDEYGFASADGRPSFLPDMSHEELIVAAESYDLGAHPPAIDWDKAYRRLPEQDIR